ncbi:MAG: flagellar biosynthetic protein FliR, partial [Lachnospiraceae bacterium]|nr:flagellar biosynthetic protein FliR [Lachnospiraceae bacterium]
DMDHLFASMTRFMMDTFIIAFRIFLPIFAVIMILNVILGILAKVAPQMNMFAVGMQIKLLVGLLVMFVTVFMLPDVANFIFKETKNMVVLFSNGIGTY